MKSVDPTIITALISGLCVAIPTIISVIVTSNTRDAVIEERIRFLSEKIDTLSDKVQQHNNFAVRIAEIERDVKTVFRLLEDFRRSEK